MAASYRKGKFMRNGFRKAALLLAVVLTATLLWPLSAAASVASASAFDLSNIGQGYVTVQYAPYGGGALKVGIRDDDTRMIQYYDYQPGTAASFPLPAGAANVSALLYEHIGGTSYRKIDGVSFVVEAPVIQAPSVSQLPSDGSSSVSNLPSSVTGYLSSVTEISFRQGDGISQKAAALTAGKKTTEAKAMAIYSYIVKNFSYDYDLYHDVLSGRVTRYTPDPNSILQSKKGICYDIASLYAAMCRSVGIPAKLVKGNSRPAGGYHAWNSVYNVETGSWVSMDLTLDITARRGASSSWRTVGSGYSATEAV